MNAGLSEKNHCILNNMKVLQSTDKVHNILFYCLKQDIQISFMFVSKKKNPNISFGCTVCHIQYLYEGMNILLMLQLDR